MKTFFYCVASFVCALPLIAISALFICACKDRAWGTMA